MAADDDLFRHFQSQNEYQNVLVERVLSADKIQIEGGQKFRLIGLKALDAPHRQRAEYDERGNVVLPKPVLEISNEERALTFTIELLEGKKVRLEFDTQRKNDDFEALAYVFLVSDNTFANAEILRYGWADLQIVPPNTKYEERLREAYQEARREKRGLQGN